MGWWHHRWQLSPLHHVASLKASLYHALPGLCFCPLVTLPVATSGPPPPEQPWPHVLKNQGFWTGEELGVERTILWWGRSGNVHPGKPVSWQYLGPMKLWCYHEKTGAKRHRLLLGSSKWEMYVGVQWEGLGWYRRKRVSVNNAQYQESYS